jgi:putative FmdB family regulatory protein
MPFYEFRCTKCEHTFEELIRNSGQSPDACPRCGHGETARLLSTFSVGAASSSSRDLGPCGRPVGGGCGGGACRAGFDG